MAAIFHVVAHVLFSAVKYYGTSNIPAITEFPLTVTQLFDTNPVTRGKGIKKLSVVLGVIAELSLFFTYFEILTSVTITGILIISFSMLHFTSMEVDTQLSLQVRPFAMLTYPLAVAGLVGALIA